MVKEYCKNLLIILFMAMWLGLSADNFIPVVDTTQSVIDKNVHIDKVQWSYPKLHLTLSTVFLMSAGLGVTRMTPTNCVEHIIAANYGIGIPWDKKISGTRGMYYQMNYFYKPKPSGFFWKFEGGASYFEEFELMSP